MTDENKSCQNCGNRCMDMDMDPYCAAPEVKKAHMFGLTLRRGPVDICRKEGVLTLWQEDTRVKK